MIYYKFINGGHVMLPDITLDRKEFPYLHYIFLELGLSLDAELLWKSTLSMPNGECNFLSMASMIKI